MHQQAPQSKRRKSPVRRSAAGMVPAAPLPPSSPHPPPAPILHHPLPPPTSPTRQRRALDAKSLGELKTLDDGTTSIPSVQLSLSSITDLQVNESLFTSSGSGGLATLTTIETSFTPTTVTAIPEPNAAGLWIM